MSSKIAGMGEIEGAKRLVALAQKWKKSADAMLKVARQEPNAVSSSVEFSKAQALASVDEVNKAEAYLAEVEQRWEVIDVDDKEDAPSTPGAPQKQQTRDEDQPDAAPTSNIVAASSSSDGSQNNADSDDDVIVLDDSGDESPTGTGATAADVPYHVTLEGCRVSTVNGTYRLVGMYNNAPKYSKVIDEVITSRTPQYNIICETTVQAVYNYGSHDKDVKKWLIVEPRNNCDGDICHYAAPADDSSNLPPKKWKCVNGDVATSTNQYRGRGGFPAPKLSSRQPCYAQPVENYYAYAGVSPVAVLELEVEGCRTLREINGTYEKNGYYNGGPCYFKVRSTDGLPYICIHRERENDQYGGNYWLISVLRDDSWVVSYETDKPAEGLPLAEKGCHWRSTGLRSTFIRVKVSGTNGASKRRKVT